MQRRSHFLSTLWGTFWILVLAVVVLFVFFLALGAFKPAEVTGLSVVVACLAAAWIAHAVWESRRRDPHDHDQATVRARERRGF
jgi:TRAP-type C4-dicarboxylate transport system permease large subunit